MRGGVILKQDGQGRPEEVVFLWNDMKEQVSRTAGKTMFLGRELGVLRTEGKPECGRSEKCSEQDGEG